jgi:hypothetical protein
MAVTADSFIAGFPEFRNAGALLTEALNRAALMVDPNVYGARTDLAVELYAAQWLARSPWGRTLRLVKEDGSETPYDKRLEELKRSAVPNMFVT